VATQSLADDEIVYRRIPPGEAWLDTSGRITSGNFKLRHKAGEVGVSVYRASQVTPTELLARPEAIRGSRLASATVGDIRRLAHVDGTSLNLDVVATDDENDPGHAEIRCSPPGRLPARTSKELARLFRLLPLSS
jgi:hypothetical protein